MCRPRLRLPAVVLAALVAFAAATAPPAAAAPEPSRAVAAPPEAEGTGCTPATPPGRGSYVAPQGTRNAALTPVATAERPVALLSRITHAAAGGTTWVVIEGTGPIGFVQVWEWGAEQEMSRAATLPVGAGPTHIAADADEIGMTTRVAVANARSCSVTILDAGGYGAEPSVLRTIDLPASPAGLAFDYFDRLYVALPALDVVAVFDASFEQVAAIDSPGHPYALAFDPQNRLWVGNSGLDGRQGDVLVLDTAAMPPHHLATLPLDGVTSLTFVGNRLYAIENGSHRLTALAYDGGNVRRISSLPLDPAFDASRPSSGTGIATTWLGGAGSGGLPGIVVGLDGADHAVVFAENPDGSLSPRGTLPGVFNVLDAEGGFLLTRDGEVLQLPIEVESLLTAPGSAPGAAYVLPGPLDVSLAPSDVARSFGIVVLVMLLLGAPTPLFNSTLSANRALIERWLRRRGRRFARLKRLRPFGRGLAALGGTWPGLALYLACAGLLYAFLQPAFPGPNGPALLGLALFGVVAGTALSQLPHELYVRRRYRERGQVRVALWTLLLAAACVVVTRLSGVQPGYVYGIIGGFAFRVALTREDRGRMAFLGMAILIAAGVAAWFLRVPFQPGSGPLADGLGSSVNDVLAGIFVNAVEGAAIGLVPLRFLDGEALLAWSRPRWLLTWAIGLLLFAHVIVYPETHSGPAPSPTGLVTVVGVAALYGAIAAGFWWFFARRARRRGRRAARPAVTEPAG